MNVQIKLISPMVNSTISSERTLEFNFQKVDVVSDATHVTIRDSRSFQLLFRTPISNIDNFRKYDDK